MADDPSPDMRQCAENIAALLTDALHLPGEPTDPPWSMTLTHDELAHASTVLARILIIEWLRFGADPAARIAALVDANVNRTL